MAALTIPAVVASPAAAVVPCTPSFGTNYDPSNPADLSLYVQEIAVDATATFYLQGMCFPTDPVVTINAADPGAGAVNFDQTSNEYAEFTYTPPSGFMGVADLDITIAFGAESRDYRFVAYVGVPGASFPDLSGAPQVGTVGVATTYDLTGLSFPSGTAAMTVLNPSGLFSAAFQPGVPSFTVTPLQNVSGPFEARIAIDNGIQGAEYRVILWVGAPIPDRVIWGPQPGPVQIEPRGTGYFTLTNFAPYKPECEIKVTNDPADVTIVVEPPALNGIPTPVGIGVRDDYVGLLTVHYMLSCKEGGGVTSKDFIMKLYVGIPIPVLAETGVDAVPPLVAGGLLLGAGALLLSRRRRLAR